MTGSLPGKNIVLCSDGTGNSDVKARGTNVFKLYEAVDIQGHKRAPDATCQVAFYDDGIGTSSLIWLRALGGAFGLGFSRNIRELYGELVHVYRPGDRLYLFGFSRGAYTVRALAGLIDYCGILDVTRFDERGLHRQIRRCLADFKQVAFRFVASDQERRRSTPASEDRGAARARRASYEAIVDDPSAPDGEVPIEFVGVWDTVGAVGVPFDWLETLISRVAPIRFADLTPAPNVRRACHALSIDDARRTFHPEMWNEGKTGTTVIEQVWFAGVHSNVGGGYPKQGLSLVALDWMMAHAEAAGLRFITADREYVRTHQDVHGTLYDSRAGLGVYYRWAPRDIVGICEAHAIQRPKLHVSALERVANGTANYAPGNVPFQAEVVSTPGRGTERPWPGGAALGSLSAQLGQLADSPPLPGGSLLAEVRSAVRSGVASYWCFVILTLLAPFALPQFVPLRHPIAAGLAGLAVPAALVAAGVLASVGIRAWAAWVDGVMDGRFAQGWSSRREELRRILYRH